MYAVIKESDGRSLWCGVYDDRTIADTAAATVGGKVYVLFHPFHKNNDGDMYGREV